MAATRPATGFVILGNQLFPPALLARAAGARKLGALRLWEIEDKLFEQRVRAFASRHGLALESVAAEEARDPRVAHRRAHRARARGGGAGARAIRRSSRRARRGALVVADDARAGAGASAGFLEQRLELFGPYEDALPERDGLYWRFIDKHRGFFAAQARLGRTVELLDRKDGARRATIFAAAETFLARVTSKKGRATAG
jgi:hypothetical protein